MASSAPAARFAEGEDPQQLGPDTEMLQHQGWALDADGMGVTKTFHFKSYFKAVVCAYGGALSLLPQAQGY
jgi:4a-hydroxytetrahydrobiopterin dehydratase